MKNKKRKSPQMDNHFFEVSVRHRDWIRTMNDIRKELHMTYSTLFILSPQRPTTDRPDIQLAMNRTRGFLRRHQREYGIYTIMSIKYVGTIDNLK
jgi:hypothetical protein